MAFSRSEMCSTIDSDMFQSDPSTSYAVISIFRLWCPLQHTNNNKKHVQQQETEHVSYTADQVTRLKHAAEKNFVKIKGTKTDTNTIGVVPKGTNTNDAELPF